MKMEERRRTPNAQRPRIVVFVAIFTQITALFSLLIGIWGFVMVISPSEEYNSLLALCFSLFCCIAGLIGMLLGSYEAWAVYTLKPYVYPLVKATLRSPVFWFLTGFRKRWDDPDIREAFQADLWS